MTNVITVARGMVDANVRVTRMLDGYLPTELNISGVADFRDRIVPDLIEDGMEIWDIGGGKHPIVSHEEKRRRGLRLVGLDIDRDELAQAPAGIYDDAIVADISRDLEVSGRADLVVCRCVLEHVENTASAIRGLSNIVRPGGRVAIFVPCRNALFARLNLALPEKLKRRLLFAFFPEKATTGGFPARYDGCTPSKIAAAAQAAGLEAADFRVYWSNNYFRPFVPAWLLWRLWTVAAWQLGAKDVCEGFSGVFRKRSDGAGGPGSP